jgi:hypothetical protein
MDPDFLLDVVNRTICFRKYNMEVYLQWTEIKGINWCFMSAGKRKSSPIAAIHAFEGQKFIRKSGLIPRGLPRLKCRNACNDLVLRQRTRSPIRGGGYNKLPIERASDRTNATFKIPRGLPRLRRGFHRSIAPATCRWQAPPVSCLYACPDTNATPSRVSKKNAPRLTGLK